MSTLSQSPRAVNLAGSGAGKPVVKFSMRIFTALTFSEKEKDCILKVQENLRACSSGGNFSERGNLHLTMAFLGETPEDRLEALFGILEETAFSPFDISFNHLGRFTRGKSELWWIGADVESPGFKLLNLIQEKLVHRLARESFSVDKKPFTAHITLGREIKLAREAVFSGAPVNIRAGRISLMESKRVCGKVCYTELLRASGG